MERDILHLSIPTFPIALARIADPFLRERPVAVAAGNSERALLQCVSREARAEGLHEGMTVAQARRYYPPLVLIPPDPERSGRAVRAVHRIAYRFSPILEPVTPGRLFLDLTGSRRLLGPGRDAAARLEREIRTGLRLSGNVGVAGNKLISRIAAGYPDQPGVCDILRGSERSFIGALPVSVLPGIGRRREQQLLHDLNLQRVQDIAALSVPQLRLAIGPCAPLVHQRACGIDPSPVQIPKRSSEIAEETFFPREANDDILLMAELYRLVENCGLRLRRLDKKTRALSLTLSYADGVRERGVLPLEPPQNLDFPLFAAAEKLFRKSCRRRVRLKGLRLACDRLAPEGRQLDLFAADFGETPCSDALQIALDELRGKFGRRAVGWGRTLAA